MTTKTYRWFCTEGWCVGQSKNFSTKKVAIHEARNHQKRNKNHICSIVTYERQYEYVAVKSGNV